MAESQLNPKLTTLAKQVDFVGADHRFACLVGAALADFITLDGAQASAVEASASVVEASASVVEASASVVEASAAIESGHSGEAHPAMSDDDCLSLGSGGNISPIRQEEKDLLDGRNWVEEMDHQASCSKEPVEAMLAEVVGGDSLVTELDSSVEGTASQASAEVVVPDLSVLERRISKVAKRAAQLELSRQTTTHNYDHFKEFMCGETLNKDIQI